MLHENFETATGRGDLRVYGGIGLCELAEKGIAAENSPWVHVAIDSVANIKKLFAAMDAGGNIVMGYGRTRPFMCRWG